MNFRSLSRTVLLCFSLYITYAFSIKYLPNSMGMFFIFLFLFLLNAGTHAALYHLMKFCNPWQEKTVFTIQLVFAGWSIYAFRFVYEKGYTGQHISTFLYTPLMQWGIVIVVVLAVIFMNADNRR
jgi:hypothetical protein